MIDEREHPDDLVQEVRSLLCELGVQGRDLEPMPGESQAAERDLAIILEGVRDVPARPSVARRVGRPLLLLAAAAVLAIGLVIVRPVTGTDPAVAQTPPILKIQDGGGTVLGQPAVPASEELLRLAGLAGAAPRPADGPVQLIVRDSWYMEIDEAIGDAPPVSVLVPVRSELYFQPDGMVRTIEQRGRPLDSDGRLSSKTGQWSSTGSRSDETFEGSEEGPDYPATLSVDPGKLSAQLVPEPAVCDGRLSFCLAVAMRSLHYSYVLEPRLNAALLRMLAQQPDIRFAGLSTDRLDRPANAFVVPGADTGQAIILLFDPESGTFLGSEDVLVEDSAELGIEAPAVIEFTALTDARRIPESAVPDASLTTYY